MLLALYSLWVPIAGSIDFNPYGKRALPAIAVSTANPIGKRTLPPVAISR